MSVSEREQAMLERGKHLVEINQASLVEAGDITAEQSAEIKTKLSFTGDINGLKDCDIIVESVLERLDVKQDFWVKAEAVVSPDCILATNTSGLSINKISCFVSSLLITSIRGTM